MGCFSSNCINKTSAGGQLEQPSEVNNSTMTGFFSPSVGGVASFIQASDSAEETDCEIESRN